MPSLEELAALPVRLLQLERRMTLLEERQRLYVETTDDEVDTATALKLTGIKSRGTLIKERKQPGTLIQWSGHGTRVSYSRKSCIDYKQARRLNQHHLSAMRVAS